MVLTDTCSPHAAHRARWRREGLHGGCTLADRLTDAVRDRESLVIFHSPVRPAEITLADAYGRSRAVAAAMLRMGMKPGDVVAVQLPNWTENLLIYLAALSIGVVVAPIIHIYGPREVGFILRASRAKLFVCPDRWRSIDYLDRIARLDAPALEQIVVVGSEAPPGGASWDAFVSGGADAAAAPLVNGNADAPAIILYTSGTTADPKGVMHSHNSLIAANTMYEALSGQGPGSTLLGLGPAGHIGGVRNMMRVFLTGGRTIFLDQWDAAAAVRLIAEHDVRQCSGGTPYFLAKLLDAAMQENVDLSRLERFAVGGASVPSALIERAERAGVCAGRVYGSTEVPSVTAYRNGDALEDRAGNDGVPAPGGAVRILDDSGADVAQGASGEVALLAPFMFTGYQDSALDRDAFTADGWFLTGDIGRVDPDGRLSIVDRKKDIIIRGGENISSREVEDVLATHPAVAECAVTGAPDATLGEAVCAFVTLRADAALDLAAVRDHFRASGIAWPKTPERLVVVDELPRTAAGKVRKTDLRARLLNS